MTALPIHKRLDYRNVLREVARSMVRLHRPERLLKLITRFIDREMQLTHTSILILDEKKKHFTFVSSKGSARFPIGFLKFDTDHPLVSWFETHKQERRVHEDFLFRPYVEKWCSVGKRGKKVPEEYKEVLDKIRKTMAMFRAELVVPGYFKRSLLAVLMLGKKKSGIHFSRSEILLFETLAHDCSMAIKTAQFNESLQKQNEELAKQIKEIQSLRRKEKETYRQILRALAQEVNAKDPYTYGHVNQVEYLGLMTAKEMGVELTEEKRDLLSAALILHDVGKIGIPDQILQKPMRLDPEEWEIMKTHVDKGAQILEPLANFKQVTEIVLCHHERFDGTGYPRGLKGEEIPVESRIIAVVDAFHAIVSKRSYRMPRPAHTAFEELQKGAGTQFDPQVVEAFIVAMKREIARNVDHPAS